MSKLEIGSFIQKSLDGASICLIGNDNDGKAFEKYFFHC